jgi:hypothetical protein
MEGSLYTRRGYYYGSFGLVRGYGALYRTLKEADDSVLDDGRQQRRNGGTTDRNAVAVSRESGQCWWLDHDEFPDLDMPVRTAKGEQAAYAMEAVRQYEGLWTVSEDLAG